MVDAGHVRLRTTSLRRHEFAVWGSSNSCYQSQDSRVSGEQRRPGGSWVVGKVEWGSRNRRTERNLRTVWLGFDMEFGKRGDTRRRLVRSRFEMSSQFCTEKLQRDTGSGQLSEIIRWGREYLCVCDVHSHSISSLLWLVHFRARGRACSRLNCP